MEVKTRTGSRRQIQYAAQKNLRLDIPFFLPFFPSNATGFLCVVGDWGAFEGYIRLHNDDYVFLKRKLRSIS